MTLFDPVAAQALLEIQDAELRRRFELALVRVAGLATVLNLDLSSIRDESAAMRKKPDSTRRKPTPACLIAKAKLLHESDFCAAIGITDQSLSKDITVRRIFSVHIDEEPYFPTFFLVSKSAERVGRWPIVRRGDGRKRAYLLKCGPVTVLNTRVTENISG
jgi:hypothetical protein